MVQRKDIAELRTKFTNKFTITAAPKAAWAPAAALSIIFMPLDVFFC
jgi:hypothetical protein